ncbi:MAG: DNA (cytosine-5-)-methyltransferase [Myxococcaceae bacterium]
MAGHPFRFVDLFAGIGGFHIALSALGGRCVFASEWDKHAQKTYFTNFGLQPAGDITQVAMKDIPEHELLTAGFPCQPFSLAGVSKNNALGRAHGFSHATQGTLFFNVKEIIAAKRPAAFILENVKNLESHDKGNTFRVIKETLTKELGYEVHHKVLDAKEFVPQHRERIFIVGFREHGTGFNFPVLKGKRPALSEILEKGPVDPKYTLTPRLWAYLKAYAEKHRAAGNGFGFGLAKPEGTTRTLSARYYKDGSEILIPQKGRRPRRLTPREAAKLMGFPKDFDIHPSDSRAYRQFGNSVVVPVVSAVAEAVLASLRSSERLARTA